MSETVLRRSRGTVYVSLDNEKSWLAIHPDGSTSVQYRTPNGPRMVSEWTWECCDHECTADSE